MSQCGVETLLQGSGAHTHPDPHPTPHHPTPATAAGRWWAHMPSPSLVCDRVSTRGAAEKLPLYCTDKLQELLGKTPVLEMPILEEITEVI